jgi:hypothetical protein
MGILQDMGFSQKLCAEALRRAGDQPELAMEWLLQQGALEAGEEDGDDEFHDSISFAADGPGRLRVLSTAHQFSMAVFYVWVRCSTALLGGFRPGQKRSSPC